MSGSKRQGASSITCPLAGWLQSSSLIADCVDLTKGPDRWCEAGRGGRHVQHFQKNKLAGLSQNCFQMDATAVILWSFTWDVWKDVLFSRALGCSQDCKPSSQWLPECVDGRGLWWGLLSSQATVMGRLSEVGSRMSADWPHTSHSRCFSLWWWTVNLLGCCHRGKDAAKPPDLVGSYLDPETTFLQLRWGEFPVQTSVLPVSVVHDHHIIRPDISLNNWILQLRVAGKRP